MNSNQNNMFFFGNTGQGGTPSMQGIPGMNLMMPDINALLQQAQLQTNAASAAFQAAS
jgi:hypothetical protein